MADSSKWMKSLAPCYIINIIAYYKVFVELKVFGIMICR